MNISYSCKGIRTLIPLLSLPFVSIKKKKGGLPNSITDFIPVYFTGILCFCFIQPVNVRQKQFASRTQDIIQYSKLPQSEITGHFVHRKNDYQTCIKLQAGCSHPASFCKHSLNSGRYKNIPVLRTVPFNKSDLGP